MCPCFQVSFHNIHSACQLTLSTESQLDSLLHAVLKIPSSSSLRLPKDRDIVAFSIWLFRSQSLPSETLRSYMPDLMQALKACFINYKANSDKPRRAAMEALSTVHFLTMQYPELFSAACIADEELRESIFNCCIKDAFSLRSKGCMALGGLYHSIYQPRPGAHQEQEQDRRTSVDLLGAYLMEFLQHQDHFNLRVLEKLLEGAKAKPEEGTLDLLLPFSVNSLKLACITAGMWMTHMLGLLPAITGRRFRKLEAVGPAMWMRLSSVRLSWWIYRTHNADTRGSIASRMRTPTSSPWPSSIGITSFMLGSKAAKPSRPKMSSGV